HLGVELFLPTLVQDAEQGLLLHDVPTYTTTIAIDRLVFHLLGVAPAILPQLAELGYWGQYLSRVWPAGDGTIHYPAGRALRLSQLDLLAHRLVNHEKHAPSDLSGLLHDVA